MPDPEATDPGDRGSGTDTGLSRRQNPIGRRESDQERTWLYKLVLACTAVCVLSAVVCVVVAGTTLKNRADIVETQQLTKAIQDERTRVTIKNCEAQNKANAEAKRKMREFVAAAPASPQIDKRVVLKLTDVLTDSFMPVTDDCKALADRNVRAG